MLLLRENLLLDAETINGKKPPIHERLLSVSSDHNVLADRHQFAVIQLQRHIARRVLARGSDAAERKDIADAS